MSMSEAEVRMLTGHLGNFGRALHAGGVSYRFSPRVPEEVEKQPASGAHKLGSFPRSENDSIWIEREKVGLAVCVDIRVGE